jgi:hypothetical protein
MSFNFDATGIKVDEKKGFEKKLLPKGMYTFEIVEFVSKAGESYPKEGTTKNGDPKVDILAQVVEPIEFEGERVFHSVTFLSKEKPGAGMSVHFLKTINQPHEGVISVDPQAWVGEQFMAFVIEDEYMGRKNNKIKSIEPTTKKEELIF